MTAQRNAATVSFVRDVAAGMEVFLLRRNLGSGFVGGAYVSGERRLVEVCRTEGPELAEDRIHHLSHWITPVRILVPGDAGYDEAKAGA